MSPSEADLQSWIIEAATTLGWLGYHTHDSRNSVEGFPDLVLVRGRIIYRELKISTRPSAVTVPQRRWLHQLRHAGADADVWTLDDWPNHITRELSSRTSLRAPRALPPPPTPEEIARYELKRRRSRITRR
ncbi:VRR-NUC domain-containing protein [Phycicoccus sp.]|uniref:VRR-NUC domain-containing protein n=1 Tax=Phycicoccus sp. TaxID=1902410 RepID=UPI002BBC9858|nr:VRR-NUC domain-containing protein [Phycicoccus sp.]HMM95380.1 VRR-NUC domain-containing protein [Phycicoccus sp.]